MVSPLSARARSERHDTVSRHRERRPCSNRAAAADTWPDAARTRVVAYRCSDRRRQRGISPVGDGCAKGVLARRNHRDIVLPAACRARTPTTGCHAPGECAYRRRGGGGRHWLPSVVGLDPFPAGGREATWHLPIVQTLCDCDILFAHRIWTDLRRKRGLSPLHGLSGSRLLSSDRTFRVITRLIATPASSKVALLLHAGQSFASIITSR